MTKRILSIAMAIMMVLCLGACGVDEAAAYRSKLSKIVEETQGMDAEVNNTVTAITEAMNNSDAAAYKEALDELYVQSETLKEKYNEIADIPAPEEYADEQKLLRQYADQMNGMLDASMELYEIVYEFLQTGALSDENITRMNDLTMEIEASTNAGTEFDEVLNGIIADK